MKPEEIKSDETVPFVLKDFKTALLVGIYFGTDKKKECEDHLAELVRLCDTFGVAVAGQISCPMKKLDAGTYLGSGKVEELCRMAVDLNAEIIIFDDEISPQQQRNLEKIFNRPVIDRTELIIEIFGQRARTKEARLQIQLAKIKYQFPRLRRLWTHLSRQRGSGGGGGSGAGGGGHQRGEGEQQIEIDKRLLRKQMDRLRHEIKEIEEQRVTQRSLRQRTGIPTFAIVGYTNAGKSTLLHALTQAEVLVEDKLFATLDTTTRKFSLPNKQDILLIDTVGFIRKIPHTLVTAFKSTLEEAVHTDILLHLVDASHPSAEEQAEEAVKVIKELGAAHHPIITVLNKIDLCENHLALAKLRLKYPRTVSISALTGEGLDALLQSMIEAISLLRKVITAKIPQSHYALVSELMREGRVISCEYEENDIFLKVEIPSSLEYKVLPFIIG